MWELEVRKGEFRRALFQDIGPALRRLDRDPHHRQDVRVIASTLAKLAKQDYHRRL